MACDADVVEATFGGLLNRIFFQQGFTVTAAGVINTGANYIVLPAILRFSAVFSLLMKVLTAHR